MKKLYIIRHAKSDWNEIYKSDFDRGLNKRGKKAILTISKALTVRGIMPDLILSSSAKRAKVTAKGLAKHMNYKGKILFLDALYMAESLTVITLIKAINDKYNNIFIVGHNPQSTELANVMIDDYISNIPTLGIVAFKVPIGQWKKFKPEKVKFQFFIYPKMFK